MTDLEQKLESHLAKNADLSDGSHDISHLRRVKVLALRIAALEGHDKAPPLIAAAYLHDLINLPKSDPNRAHASTLSAKAAHPIMEDMGLSEDDIDTAAHAIEAHSYSAGIEPRTLTAKILQDADRIDALGAIGIARTFYIAGKMGSNLFDPDDPFAEDRALDDRAFALDHFEVKLLKLVDTMQTDGGRQIAQERTEFMRKFVEQFGQET
ncbi:HD domain-containing protein (plasmid) [Phaeobacter sp. BS23]|uniref:HD domain-containing protein n=1 Tax=Phaeobacter sp. BS23 TaxID=2907239 RepID=UPI003703EDE8